MTLAKVNLRLRPTLDVDFDQDGNIVGLAVNLAYDVAEDGTVVASNTRSIGVWNALTSTEQTQVNRLYKKFLAEAQRQA